VTAHHVRKAAQPHKAIGVMPIAELANQGHANRFLRFDKMALK
jgi:hypothetical protein